MIDENTKNIGILHINLKVVDTLFEEISEKRESATGSANWQIKDAE